MKYETVSGLPTVRWRQCEEIPDRSCVVLRCMGDGAPEGWLIPRLKSTDVVVAPPYLLQARYVDAVDHYASPYRLHQLGRVDYDRVILDCRLFRRQAKHFWRLVNACQGKTVIYFHSFVDSARMEELRILIGRTDQ